MGKSLEGQLATCENLLSKIKAEYPDGEFDREMLHGEMDFRYRRIKELRQKLDAMPQEVRGFCRFTQSLTVPQDSLRCFLQFLLNQPTYLATLSGRGCRETAIRLAAYSEESCIPLADLNQIVGRMRMHEILDQSYQLVAIYHPVIGAFLALQAARMAKAST